MAVAGGSTSYADYLALYNASLGKPLVKLWQQSSQSITSNTTTALTFGAGSEVIDTHGFHDVSTNTSRITPNIPGWYRWTGAVAFVADTDIIDLQVSIGKNGTGVAPQQRLILPSTATASASRSLQVVVIEQANGSTDYFEVRTLQLQAAAASLGTNANGVLTLTPTFECEFIRAL